MDVSSVSFLSLQALCGSTSRKPSVNFLTIVTENTKVTHSIKLKGVIEFYINCFKSSLLLKTNSDRIVYNLTIIKCE